MLHAKFNDHMTISSVENIFEGFHPGVAAILVM